mgnify:CR=1 FL=1
MKKVKEKGMEIVFLIAACVSILSVALICIFLFMNGIPAIKEIGFFNFVGGKIWKPGNMLYPLPAVMVSCQSSTAHDSLCEKPELDGKPNIITVAWAGTVCTNPPMVSISVRPERYSYHLIEESGEFVINLTTEKLVKATDYCGVRSGRDVNKFKEMHLTPLASKHIHAPGIAESPVNIECKVREIKPLGSHSMILADVVGVTIDDTLLDEKGKFELNKSGLVTYSHGEYFLLGKKLGTFGYSVKKEKKRSR